MGRGKICVFGCNKMCASISVVLVIGIVTTCVIGFLAKRRIPAAEPTLRFVSIVSKRSLI